MTARTCVGPKQMAQNGKQRGFDHNFAFLWFFVDENVDSGKSTKLTTLINLKKKGATKSETTQ